MEISKRVIYVKMINTFSVSNKSIFKKKLFQKDICFTFLMHKLIVNCKLKKHNGHNDIYKDFIG